MFVYQGKLQWYNYGKDETLAVVLPNGFARDGDTAYIFSQWTVDAQGRKKYNWFQTLVVSNLTKTSSGDDSFVLKGAYYTWKITTQQTYSKISITMSNPQKDKSTMTADRVWESKGEQDTGDARIWTGKFNYIQYASNEPAIFIAPDGFGDGKPILSLWHCVQKALSKPGGGNYQFSFTDYYTLTCTWNDKNESLAARLRYGSGQEYDVATLNLSAKIERETRDSHSLDPPSTPGKKVEVETHLPQVQPSLRRLLTPLPFPGKLLDTLEHTAAFLDQAGYLARYAQDHFAALDADYHVQVHLVEALQKENINLKEQIKKLTDALRLANAKADELQRQIDAAKTDAKKKEEELRKRIHELENENIKDDKLLDDLRKELAALLAKIAQLENDLAALLVEKKTLLSQITTLQESVVVLEAQKVGLENSLKVQKDLNDALEKTNADLTKENKTLTDEKTALQAQLAKTQPELADTQEIVKKTQLDLESANKKLKRSDTKLQDREGDLERLRDLLVKADRKINKLEDRLADNDINFSDLK
ncbi:uncharacterized protein NECHADRAFT_82783 [Fusarium vanettenii 77-13-4]|uniref:Uncharacterized protein n=1 Tax=Fusarium vanettenii (strain ATCC MYA-4622 / CBS 123669 / FGSC 9596 / NRRL 45880 / 77-13-4) TaxID=660122 RepID=C7YWU1_FUSV7|nr:uncharacterized protein NECHADRAFT_82783 [Fusarium vanettenii 77-13-4]EEU43465.1 hypothetical protein NECHADRAFT_82783 [Fusarium vanettenii 77-13-4]